MGFYDLWALSLLFGVSTINPKLSFSFVDAYMIKEGSKKKIFFLSFFFLSGVNDSGKGRSGFNDPLR